MKHPVKWLIALNILTLVITLVMFAVGFAANTMTYKMERDLLNASVTEVSAKMEKRIGKSYTADLHESVIAFMESGEKVMVSSVGTMRSFTTAMFQSGAWIFLISLTNLLLLWKTKRVYDTAAALRPPEP
ncbi:hypothetical protein OVA24_17960 [Luteolibacter sp. SL250]|uniref:hypothetical protein n=1 Tax=Luteolibacter sp. SL250 TaxID=2995170 RepID=UPI00226EED54|nr:hypothetical protein [Luteolibacter sp. SL250]WAC19115.1 hypothetical protein OVA24_17960 [Luteolibacter sp. SL250]